MYTNNNNSKFLIKIDAKSTRRILWEILSIKHLQ